MALPLHIERHAPSAPDHDPDFGKYAHVVPDHVDPMELAQKVAEAQPRESIGSRHLLWKYHTPPQSHILCDGPGSVLACCKGLRVGLDVRVCRCGEHLAYRPHPRAMGVWQRGEFLKPAEICRQVHTAFLEVTRARQENARRRPGERR